jgi:GT2 family glycosyltransferase
MKMKVAVVIPNWNGEDMIVESISSLLAQTYEHTIIVVDNGSGDNSVSLIEQNFPNITLLKNPKNLGFAGGVNTGIKYALEQEFDAVALINNDAIAHKEWLRHLVNNLDDFPEVGITTCKLLSMDKSHFDSTGDIYTTWGIPYPRGRDEQVSTQYDNSPWVFGASGGASLYRSTMLTEIGLFDEDFFAYYEDVDISFRAQLAGWKVRYEPKAEVYHATSSTGSKIPGFFTYQTIKNYPFVFWKNVPLRLFPTVLPRFTLAYVIFVLKGLFTLRRTIPTLKGLLVTTLLLPKKLVQRRKIMKNKKVSNDYICSILTWDLPPNANKLRSLRGLWWKLTGKQVRS